MPSIVEQDILEKFQQLDQDAQKRVHMQLSQLMQDTSAKKFDYQAWAEQVDANRVIANTTNPKYATVLELLDEVREERDNDILRGSGSGDFSGSGMVSPN